MKNIVVKIFCIFQIYNAVISPFIYNSLSWNGFQEVQLVVF